MNQIIEQCVTSAPMFSPGNKLVNIFHIKHAWSTSFVHFSYNGFMTKKSQAPNDSYKQKDMNKQV